MIKIKN